MIQLALNISRLSVPLLIEACRRIISMMTANPSFPTPSPTLGSITLLINALETAYQQRLSGLHSATVIVKNFRKKVLQQMGDLKVYVQTTSGSNEEMGLSSGMSLRRKPEHLHTIDQPQNVRATTLPAAGQAKVMWKGVKRRKNYLVYSTTELADPLNQNKWALLASTTLTQLKATGLTSGIKYAFIVLAVGAGGVVSQPGDPAIAVIS